ncbi:hypothetical protein BHE74_00023347 [Ensete ventricosum]|nr:hypothetical protein BHE74_00023347 [Ensete ventricosum]
MPWHTAWYALTIPYRAELNTPLWYDITNLERELYYSRKVMGRIHAIQSDGTVLRDVEVCHSQTTIKLYKLHSVRILIAVGSTVNAASNLKVCLQAFRRLYEEVGLGWIYAVTKYEPVSLLRSKTIPSLIDGLKF